MENGKKCLYVVLVLTRRLRVRAKKCVFWHPIARACCQTHFEYGPPKMPLKLAL